MFPRVLHALADCKDQFPPNISAPTQKKFCSHVCSLRDRISRVGRTFQKLIRLAVAGESLAVVER
jgi:hypothetical protein